MSIQIYSQDITYFVQGEITKRIKIGKTTTYASERIRQLQSGSPDILIYLGSCFGCGRDEQALHEKFSEFRLHGEWFIPAEEIIEFIDSNCITDQKAFNFAYQKIEEKNFTFNDALEIGTSKLKELAEQTFINKMKSL